MSSSPRRSTSTDAARHGAVKIGTKLRIEVVGELAQTVARITARKGTHKVRSLALVVNERGQALTYSALDGRFGKARAAAGS